MGPAEIEWRFKQVLTIAIERVAHRHGLYDWTCSDWRKRLCKNVNARQVPQTLEVWWHRHMQEREEPPFLLDHETLAESAKLFKQLFSERIEHVVGAAECVCRGEFSFFGVEFEAHPEINWHQDPLTGRSWPKVFWADLRVPFCDGTGSKGSAGDSKYVWELNRHEFLISCGKAFVLTQDSKYARRAFELISNWIAENRYLEGINWAGPLEVAVRSLAWLWTYQFCRKWAGYTEKVHLEVIKAFYLHGSYLFRHLEIYSSPNNHLVGEATALYLLGSFFPEFDKSAAWQSRAWNILESQSQRQYFADGGSTEQATSYHHYCLGFFVLAVLTRLEQKLSVSAAMLERLESAFAFSMWMTTPDGTVPRIGDTDNARSICFGPFVQWDFRNLLSIGAVLFRRGDFNAVANAFSEDALWLLGRPGLRTFQELSLTPPPETVQLFPSSGYAILRDGWQREGHHTCLDCGEIGLDLRGDDVPLFTHGHADMLNVMVSSFGKPLLVDAGFYTYNGSPEWHRYTRDVQGHNTIRLDGHSQAKFHRKNAWARVSRPGPLLWESRDCFEYVEGSHGGFFGVKTCTSHRRAVVWNRESCWLILDRLEGTGIHHVEVFFHFAPGRLHTHSDGAGASIVTDGGLYAMLRTTVGDELKLDAACGGAEPERGWIATGYGCKEPAPVVRYHGHLQLPCTLTFVLTASQIPVSVPVIERYEITGNAPGKLINSVSMRVATDTGEKLLEIGESNSNLEASLSTQTRAAPCQGLSQSSTSQ